MICKYIRNTAFSWLTEYGMEEGRKVDSSSCDRIDHLSDRKACWIQSSSTALR